MTKLTEEQKLMIINGVREPDIVKEGKACLMVLALFVLAILVVAAVLGAFWLVQKVIMSIC